MFSNIVGNIDTPAAAFLIAMVVCAAIVITVFLTMYTSKEDAKNKLTLAKLEAERTREIGLLSENHHHELNLAKVAANREVEVRRIDSGMLDLKVTRPNDTNDVDL